MKTLPLDQIKSDEIFIKENKDILPEEFFISPQAYVWFYNMIKDGVRSEECQTKSLSHIWSLFDKADKKFILSYSKLTQYTHMSKSNWSVLTTQFQLDDKQINKLCKQICEQHFNCKVNYIFEDRSFIAEYFENEQKGKEAPLSGGDFQNR